MGSESIWGNKQSKKFCDKTFAFIQKNKVCKNIRRCVFAASIVRCISSHSVDSDSILTPFDRCRSPGPFDSSDDIKHLNWRGTAHALAATEWFPNTIVRLPRTDRAYQARLPGETWSTNRSVGIAALLPTTWQLPQFFLRYPEVSAHSPMDDFVSDQSRANVSNFAMPLNSSSCLNTVDAPKRNICNWRVVSIFH